MKKYIGTKQIEAEPMTLGEACSKGLVKSEIEKNESYKLGYHTRTEYGYESWSPKKLIHGFRLLAMCLPMIGRLFNSLSATCKKCNGCVGCL